MRDRIRRVVEGYKPIKLKGQEAGYVLFSGQEPDTRWPVLIKVLPRLLGDDPQIAARFRDLARTIRRLNHPNISSIRRVGEEAGLPYIVTQAIEKAQPLAAKLNQPWAVDAAADVVMEVGHALEHAYHKGVIHGALSPDNVLIRDDGRVTVTDFGLVELQNLLGVHFREAASPYLAPEQAAGRAADARADVYSLGALLYSLLTGRQPQVVQGKVLPPSRFNPDVSQTMDAVVVKALAPDPADRYPEAASFLAALGAVALAPAVVKRRPVAPGQRCPRCKAENQTGRFCRKCGFRLKQPPPSVPPPAPSQLDEPIQITRIEVGRVDVGKRVDLHETAIGPSAGMVQVATGDILAQFPEPPEVPRLDLQELWPTLDGEPLIAMPEPPPMPAIDWAEMTPTIPPLPTLEDIPVSTEGD